MAKEKQVRMTLQDTLVYQDKIRDLIKLLTNDNRPLSQQEKKEILQMVNGETE